MTRLRTCLGLAAALVGCTTGPIPAWVSPDGISMSADGVPDYFTPAEVDAVFAATADLVESTRPCPTTRRRAHTAVKWAWVYVSPDLLGAGTMEGVLTGYTARIHIQPTAESSLALLRHEFTHYVLGWVCEYEDADHALPVWGL